MPFLSLTSSAKMLSKSIMKKIAVTFLLTCLFYYPDANSQNKQDNSFTTYEQNVPGTNINFKMIPIAAGSFNMGSPKDEKGHQADEGPVTKVKLDAFWMGEHEVTYDEYVLFLDENKDP